MERGSGRREDEAEQRADVGEESGKGRTVEAGVTRVRAERKWLHLDSSQQPGRRTDLRGG